MKTPRPGSLRAPSTPFDPQLRRSIVAIMTGGMAVVFDTTILSVAIPTLGRDFDAPLDDIQWVATGYLLAMFSVIPVAGWAQTRFGARRLWLAALTVFTTGSLLCGFAGSTGALVAARVVQGLGGGIIVPLMATVLMQAAGGRAPGRLMAVVGLPMALGPIVGPVIGGVVLHYVDWPWLFWINLPMGVLGFVMAARMLPPDPPTTHPRLDVAGFLLATGGAVALIYGLSNVADDGGFVHADVLVPGGLGLVLAVGYVAHALARGEGALIDLTLLRHRGLATSTALMGVAGLAMYGAMFVLPLYYQGLRGADALGTGLMLIPQGVGALAARGLAGRLTDTIGARPVVLTGFLVMTAATVPFAFADASSNGFLLGLVLLVRGIGTGGVFMPLMATAYVGLAHDEIPHASIVTRVAQQIGGSFGIAVLAVVLQGRLAEATTPDAAADAFHATFWWAVAFMTAGACLSWLLPGRQAVAEDDGSQDVTSPSRPEPVPVGG